MSAQLDLFQSNLPRKPYCTEELGSLCIRGVSHAVKKRYIQPNHPNSKLWLLYDVDRPTGPEELTDELNLPAPTIWVRNPQNNHAHALYALDNPVHMNAKSSQAAIRFAAAVDVALSVAMGADAGYVGLICKNPLHEYWKTYTIAGSYDLNELTDYLDLSVYQDRRKHLPEVGLGRNCTLFDQARKWAYKAIRQGWPQYDQWLKACLTRCQGYNARFDTPLPTNEVEHTARSIAKWTYRNMNQASWTSYVAKTHTSEIQSKRGKKGAVKGAMAAAKVKRDKRETAIIKAISDLKMQGEKPTKVAIGRIVGISDRALRKDYAHLFTKTGT